MKCAVYTRVSTDKEEQKTSLENQQRFFYNIIAEKGWDLFRFYIDVESGTKERKRENLRQLIEDAKQNADSYKRCKSHNDPFSLISRIIFHHLRNSSREYSQEPGRSYSASSSYV